MIRNYVLIVLSLLILSGCEKVVTETGQRILTSHVIEEACYNGVTYIVYNFRGISTKLDKDSKIIPCKG